MTPPNDKLYRLKRTLLTPEQLRQNAAAMLALADGQRIEYFSPILQAWCECWCCDTDFVHRIRPVEEQPAEPTWNGQLNVEAAVAASLKKQPSTDVNDY